MAELKLTALTLFWLIVLSVPLLAGQNDGTHFNGGTCLYRGNLNNGIVSPMTQGAIFYWYRTSSTSGTQTMFAAYRSNGTNVPIMTAEHFRNSSGQMVLHFYVEGTVNGPAASQYMNIYSALPLVTNNTPAYVLLFWDSDTGSVTIDMNGTYSSQGASSFIVGTPFVTYANNLPWTVGCALDSSGTPIRFLNSDVNQLYIDQGDDDYTRLSIPNGVEQGFVIRYVTNPATFKPMPMGLWGTAVFGINHGAPSLFMEGDPSLFLQNTMSQGFTVMTGSLSAAVNFPWGQTYP